MQHGASDSHLLLVGYLDTYRCSSPHIRFHCQGAPESLHSLLHPNQPKPPRGTEVPESPGHLESLATVLDSKPYFITPEFDDN